MPVTPPLGARGESLACDFLARKGFKILERNYRSRAGEIDVIARKRDLLLFVEVKTRRSDRRGRGVLAVTPAKLGKLAAAARVYVMKARPRGMRYRFDVVEVTWDDPDAPGITWFENVYREGL
jgi:putative endonuclease